MEEAAKECHPTELLCSGICETRISIFAISPVKVFYLRCPENVRMYAMSELISASDKLPLNGGMLPFPLAMIWCNSASVWFWTAVEPRAGAFRLFPTAVGVPFAPQEET